MAAMWGIWLERRRGTFDKMEEKERVIIRVRLIKKEKLEYDLKHY